MERKNKSKLEIITNSLKDDQSVIVLPFVDDNANGLRKYFEEFATLLFEPGSGHLVKLYVAPTQGLYMAKELQSFMEGLLPKLKPSLINRFNQGINCAPENFLSMGNLNFREIYGKEKIIVKRDCKMHDDVFANDFNFKDGKKNVENKLIVEYHRLIQVNVYPNEEIGKNALKRYQESLKDKNRSMDLDALLYVSLDEIQKYEPKIIEKLKTSGQEKFI